MSERKGIRAALLNGKKISALSALRDFGCMRLASRIHEIRGGAYGDKPLDVADIWRAQRGKRYKVYFVPGVVRTRYVAAMKVDSEAKPRPRGRPRGSRKA